MKSLLYLFRNKLILILILILNIIVCQKNSHCDLIKQMKTIYANANMLLTLFSKCSIHVKCYLFKTYCLNLYCSLLWYSFTPTEIKEIKIAYHNSIRKLFFFPNITVLVR